MNRDYETELAERRAMMKGWGYGAGGEGRPASDQAMGVAAPPLFGCGSGMEEGGGEGRIIPLPRDFHDVAANRDVIALMENRKSRRLFDREEQLTLTELSFLLWMTQGVKEIAGNAVKVTVRTVPSAGARHALETYLFLNRVEGVQPGLYHYLAQEHKLQFMKAGKEQVWELSAAFGGQTFFANSAAAFIWTAVPYRMEWRYQEYAQKYILLDAGHVCQNLYLAGEALGCGVCAIGAYDQDLADRFLGLEKKSDCPKDEEFVIYAACVGR